MRTLALGVLARSSHRHHYTHHVYRHHTYGSGGSTHWWVWLLVAMAVAVGLILLVKYLGNRP